MESFFHLTSGERLGFFIMVAVLFAFIFFLLVAGVLILKPTRVGPGGVSFGGKKKKDENETAPTIMQHRLFHFMESVLMPGALRLDDSTDKSIICENFMRIKFETLRDGFVSFFRQVEQNGFDDLSKLPGKVSDWITEYETRADHAVHELKGGTICRLPQSFKRKFSKWHHRHAEQLFADYTDLLADRGIQTRRERALLLAEATYFALRETVEDARLTLADLNGDLDEELKAMLAEESCE